MPLLLNNIKIKNIIMKLLLLTLLVAGAFTLRLEGMSKAT